MRKIILSVIIVLASMTGQAQDIGGDYYVAPIGHSYAGMGAASDLNDGSYLNPFATWQKAFETATPGNTVYFRGGTWYPEEVEFQSAICLIDPLGEYHPGTPRGYSGTAAGPIKYLNYPGEQPTLDCRHIQPDGNYFIGISMHSVHHITLRGLEIKNIWSHGKSGVQIQGITSATASYRTFENLKIHDLGGRGMGCSSIVGYNGITSDTTRWINCDFYNLADTLMSNPFNMSDGVKSDCEVGGILIYEGCRFWNCSDDGLDVSGPGKKVIKNCWSFENGVNFTDISFVDDGNGFKLGGVRDSIEFPNWEMYNCISAGNLRFAIHALDYTPYYRNNARVYNSLFYKNEEGIFSFGNTSKPWHDTEFYNCITYANISRQIGIFEWGYPITTCNWDFAEGSIPYRIPNDVCEVTDDDFVSVDINLLKAPRKEDGSLPDVNFFKLVAGSDLINKGTDVGISYTGTAPDIGVFEYNEGAPTAIFTATPGIAEINETINFDASASNDDGSIISYAWDFGDGQTATGITATHSYTAAGSYTSQLTVTDNEANEGTTTIQIVVNAAAIGVITSIAELESALALIDGIGGTLEIESNTMTGDITITESGLVNSPIIIRSMDGYAPVFGGNVTITGDFVRMTMLWFDGNVSITNCQGAYFNFNEMTGSNTYIFTKPRSGNKGRDWLIDSNIYNAPMSSTWNGRNFGIYQSIYKLDANSIAQ